MKKFLPKVLQHNHISIDIWEELDGRRLCGTDKRILFARRKALSRCSYIVGDKKVIIWDADIVSDLKWIQSISLLV